MGDNASNKPVIKSPLTAALHKGSKSEGEATGKQKAEDANKVTRTTEGQRSSIKQLQLKYKAAKEGSDSPIARSKESDIPVKQTKDSDSHKDTKIIKVQELQDSSGDNSPRPPEEPKSHNEIHHGGLHHNMHANDIQGPHSNNIQGSKMQPGGGSEDRTEDISSSTEHTPRGEEMEGVKQNAAPASTVKSALKSKAPVSKSDETPGMSSPDSLSLSLDGVPDPSTQREVIAQVNNECTCSYAVLKTWYRRWEEHVDIQGKGVDSEPPGPIEMDIHNDANNDYISEEAWKHLIKWYGIADSHQLDRRHLYFKDEKMFDVCTLSPFSGIVEHTVKKFNRFEEIGYIECQLRRVFHVPDHKRTRMWISEKAQVPRFRQLLLRFRMLNDCIHRDKMYILALEEGLSGDGWPTGEPGEPKGELTKYAALVSGYKPEDHWSTHIEAGLDLLSVSLNESLRNMAEAFMKNGQALVTEREGQLQATRQALEQKLEETRQKERFLDEKTKEVTKQEEKLRQERQTLTVERTEFEERERKFKEEVEMMERVNKIQENKVKLDIGGQIHTTSIQTLRKDPDSMLSAMFSGRHSLHKETDGSYFIDRDHSYFRYILNFLRDGTIEPGTLPTKVYALREILREARYYQLSGLVNYLEEIIQERSSGSSS